MGEDEGDDGEDEEDDGEDEGDEEDDGGDEDDDEDNEDDDEDTDDDDEDTEDDDKDKKRGRICKDSPKPKWIVKCKDADAKRCLERKFLKRCKKTCKSYE